MPIDFFFKSLAQNQRELAICIILSGTGSDGTQGLRTIKGEGGIVMVQKPESTEYDGMPKSAINTGFVDYDLLPEEMPAQLLAYKSHSFHHTSGLIPDQLSVSEISLNKIFILLRAQTGHDFSLYKPNTIQRRIDRRMAVNQIEEIDDFLLSTHKLQSLGFIINELITNIMKYAFLKRDDGKITLHASEKNNLITLIIEDNGSGIPESIDLKHSTGFGLMIINMLADQLHGTLRIDREGGNNGTKIILEFQK
jgi:signal transduction histidine kinase